MYQVVAGKKTMTFNHRKEAVLAARKVSSRYRQDVLVLREDGIERMVYRRGRIESGAYGERRRRRVR